VLGWLASRLTEVERARTTVVFDSKYVAAGGRELQFEGMRILFAVDYPDADTLIEELIAKHSSPKQLAVISSDQRILSAALARRASAIKSHDWFDQLETRRHTETPSAEPEEKPEVSDQERLIREFDTAEIRQLIDDETESVSRSKRRRRPRN
jgi:predicted RNA-binding protein with PIN domain